MTNFKRPVLASVTFLALGILGSAGCSSPNSGEVAPKKDFTPSVSPMAAPSITEMPPIENTRDKALPIEKYLINPTENTQIDLGWARKVSACMKRFGFDYSPIVREDRSKTSQTAHRYDPTDLLVASSRGYHGNAGVSAESTESPRPISQDMQAVLGSGVGAPQNKARPERSEFKGIPIPAGGCAGEAQKAIEADGGAMQDSQIAMDINFNNYIRSMADGRVKEVFGKWSACMRVSGYSYDTPVSAVNDPRWNSPAPSGAEIATAAADVKCKQENNVIGIWFTVEAAYEEKEIQGNLKELVAVRDSIEIALRNSANAMSD